jgi:hypothetical protein
LKRNVNLLGKYLKRYGWVSGWVQVKAVVWVACSNKKLIYKVFNLFLDLKSIKLFVSLLIFVEI